MNSTWWCFLKGKGFNQKTDKTWKNYPNLRKEIKMLNQAIPQTSYLNSEDSDAQIVLHGCSSKWSNSIC